MLKIRLTRGGKKHQPTYRIVVTPKENPVAGQYLASLGTYNPLKEQVTINTDEVVAWLNKGAQPSNRIARLLSKAGVEHKSIVVKTFEPRPAKKAVDEKPEEAAKPESNEAAGDETTDASEETPATDEEATTEEVESTGEEAQPTESEEPETKEE